MRNATESTTDHRWQHAHDVLLRAASGEILSDEERLFLTDLDLQVRRIRESNAKMREVLAQMRHAKVLRLEAGDILVLENPYLMLHQALELSSVVE